MKLFLKFILSLFTLSLICLITILFFTNKNNPLNKTNNFNMMILGLDPRNDALEKTEVTDTIIFASLNFDTNKLNMISLPRDLWSYSLNAKINQIYPQNIDNYETIQSEFSKIIGQKIDKTVIVTTQNLIDLVNILGGVSVTLENGFRDEKYPNPEYIKNPSKEIPIYKTIEFPSGEIYLDSSNITEFVRSRHGSDNVANGGTDLARIKRQQILIQSVFHKMLNPQYIEKLNNFYRKEIKTNLSYSDLSNVIFRFKLKILNLELNKIDLPIGTNSKNGVIYYPNKLTNKQWAFIPSDKDYKSFQEFIDKSIQ
jgi:polyisoprenyl-teichoic acid--peptidoglycan teichoic acid transferase